MHAFILLSKEVRQCFFFGDISVADSRFGVLQTFHQDIVEKTLFPSQNRTAHSWNNGSAIQHQSPHQSIVPEQMVSENLKLFFLTSKSDILFFYFVVVAPFGDLTSAAQMRAAVPAIRTVQR